jgi:protein-disulfide isomerase
VSENNREARRAARERLREEQRRDEARARRNRGIAVVGAAVAVVVIAAAVGTLVANRDGGDGGGGANRSAAAPRGATGDPRTVIPVGPADARAVITVYEDFRCPACGLFEKQLGPTLAELTEQGRARVDYHIVSFIDDNIPGNGSKRAANAAACAQDAGAFPRYHEVLYANQPPESDDAYGDTGRLIELARQVPALKDNAGFRQCVEQDRFRDWVDRVQEEFGTSGHTSTPTVLLGDRKIYPDQNTPLTPERLRSLVDQANKGA